MGFSDHLIDGLQYFSFIQSGGYRPKKKESLSGYWLECYSKSYRNDRNSLTV